MEPLARPVHRGGEISREGKEGGGMVELYLHRFQQGAGGTFGLLTIGGKVPLCLTCEDPWNDNKTGISCIPEGIYPCKARVSAKYKNHWILENTSPRELILIHNGNTINDTRGCILVGNQLGMVGGKTAVLNSVKTLNKLREILPDRFTLHITNLHRQALPKTLDA